MLQRTFGKTGGNNLAKARIIWKARMTTKSIHVYTFRISLRRMIQKSHYYTT